jgi:hypothetical protein
VRKESTQTAPAISPHKGCVYKEQKTKKDECICMCSKAPFGAEQETFSRISKMKEITFKEHGRNSDAQPNKAPFGSWGKHRKIVGNRERRIEKGVRFLREPVQEHQVEPDFSFPANTVRANPFLHRFPPESFP